MTDVRPSERMGVANDSASMIAATTLAKPLHHSARLIDVQNGPAERSTPGRSAAPLEFRILPVECERATNHLNDFRIHLSGDVMGGVLR